MPCIALTLYKKGDLLHKGSSQNHWAAKYCIPLQQPLTAADQHQHRIKSLSTSSDTSIPWMVLHDFDIFEMVEMVWNRACKLVWEVQASQVLLFFFFFWGGRCGRYQSCHLQTTLNCAQLHSTAQLACLLQSILAPPDTMTSATKWSICLFKCLLPLGDTVALSVLSHPSSSRNDRTTK